MGVRVGPDKFEQVSSNEPPEREMDVSEVGVGISSVENRYAQKVQLTVSIGIKMVKSKSAKAFPTTTVQLLSESSPELTKSRTDIVINVIVLSNLCLCL